MFNDFKDFKDFHEKFSLLHSQHLCPRMATNFAKLPNRPCGLLRWSQFHRLSKEPSDLRCAGLAEHEAAARKLGEKTCLFQFPYVQPKSEKKPEKNGLKTQLFFCHKKEWQFETTARSRLFAVEVYQGRFNEAVFLGPLCCFTYAASHVLHAGVVQTKTQLAKAAICSTCDKVCEARKE